MVNEVAAQALQYSIEARAMTKALKSLLIPDERLDEFRALYEKYRDEEVEIIRKSFSQYPELHSEEPAQPEP